MVQHHTISGLVGKLVIESEVNCNADRYYEIWKHHEDLPNATPQISGVKVFEGHGTTSGCIKQWNYTVDMDLLRLEAKRKKYARKGKILCILEKTTYNDDMMTICHSHIEGDTMTKYKKFDGILLVKPKANGHGSTVSWTIEYEKINEVSPIPIDYLGFSQSLIEDVNSHICT
ncbi:major latex protein 15-like [Papaver somniferum]|uniref:major latex protein 15-like n=1 Tax=Papaver somniferum TaxID=3469 RepID=UPI000E701D3C|nr:major latex protein 15-like [Papaver somniferum]